MAAVVVGGAMLERAGPDVARSLRMWRQFTPIYLRYLWTRWRCRKRSPLSWEVLRSLRLSAVP